MKLNVLRSHVCEWRWKDARREWREVNQRCHAADSLSHATNNHMYMHIRDKQKLFITLINLATHRVADTHRHLSRVKRRIPLFTLTLLVLSNVHCSPNMQSFRNLSIVGFCSGFWVWYKEFKAKFSQVKNSLCKNTSKGTIYGPQPSVVSTTKKIKPKPSRTGVILLHPLIWPA